MDWPLSLPKLANPIFLAFHCQTGTKIPRNLYSPERRLWLMSICQNVLTRLNQHKPSGPSLTTVLLYYIYSTIVRSCRGRQDLRRWNIKVFLNKQENEWCGDAFYATFLVESMYIYTYTYLTFKPTFVRNLKKLTHCLLAFNNVFINCLKDLPHEYTNLYYHSNLRQHFVFLRKFSKAFKKVGNV